MRAKMRDWLVKGQVKAVKAMEGFAAEEKGASHMVEIIVVIVIVMAVAIAFQDAITEAAETVMQEFTEFVGGEAAS